MVFQPVEEIQPTIQPDKSLRNLEEHASHWILGAYLQIYSPIERPSQIIASSTIYNLQASTSKKYPDQLHEALDEKRAIGRFHGFENNASPRNMIQWVMEQVRENYQFPKNQVNIIALPIEHEHSRFRNRWETHIGPWKLPRNQELLNRNSKFVVYIQGDFSRIPIIIDQEGLQNVLYLELESQEALNGLFTGLTKNLEHFDRIIQRIVRFNCNPQERQQRESITQYLKKEIGTPRIKVIHRN